MAGLKRIAFYADAPRPGGHEAMALRIIEVLQRSEGFDPVLVASPAVIETARELSVSSVELPFSGGTPLPFLLNLNPVDVWRAASKLIAVAPDLLVVVQGNIEMGVKGLLAGRIAGIRTVSYLPLAFSFHEIGAPLGRLRDVVDRVYYRIPQGFVTVTTAQATRLRRRARAAIRVVTNPVEETDLATDGSRRSPAASADRDDDVLHVGTVGRVYMRQKNQEVLVRVAALARRAGRRLCVHVIGGGPDLELLAEQAAEAGLTESEFRIHGHMERRRALEFVARRIDVLVIPSRFEGSPLVLLEAAALGKPFLVARREFSAEYALPDVCLVDPENPQEILERLYRVREPASRGLLSAAGRRIVGCHTKQRFEAEALSAFAALSED